MLIRVGAIFKGYRDIFILLYCLKWLHLLFQPKNDNIFLLFKTIFSASFSRISFVIFSNVRVFFGFSFFGFLSCSNGF